MATVKLASALVIALVATACSRTGAGGATDGPTIYASSCAMCHGPAGKPPEAMVARLGVKDLTDPAVRVRMTQPHVEQQVKNGSANKLMPPFRGALTDAQISAVAAFVVAGTF